MTPLLIRDIAASRSGNLVAAAEYEKVVHIWDVAQRKRLRTFETTMDGGGERLAIDPSGQYCAVGAFRKHGMALYSTEGGEEIWRRNDIDQVQSVRFSPSGSEVACAAHEGPLYILDAAVGNTHETVSRCSNIHYGEDDNTWLLSSKSLIVVARNGRSFSIPPESFGVLSACFTGSHLCISEADGPIRCFDIDREKELWRFRASAVEHALLVGFHEDRNIFMGILSNFDIGGHPRLCHFGVSTGNVVQVSEVPEAGVAAAFVLNGRQLLTADGALRDTLSGEVVGWVETS